MEDILGRGNFRIKGWRISGQEGDMKMNGEVDSLVDVKESKVLGVI